MSIELALGIIGTLLGIANFVYWSWLAKREKIVVVSSGVHAFLETKKDIQKSNAAVSSPKAYTLCLSSGCDLVLVKGESEIEILGVDVRFDEKIYEKLRTYFELPAVNLLQLLTYKTANIDYDSQTLLRPKVGVSFNGRRSSEANSKFEEEPKKLGDKCVDVSCSIDSLLRQFQRSKYELRLIRYDGKELCWRFPDRWWRNLGKKLWG